jgi:hypothetical protein
MVEVGWFEVKGSLAARRLEAALRENVNIMPADDVTVTVYLVNQVGGQW